jgi:NodT family efflux transporter outer membrane factor (OMF) lipoprotein
MSILNQSIFGRLTILCIGWIAVGLYGCAAGPDFVRPSLPHVHSYTASQTPSVISPETGEPRQRIHIGQEISSQWWDLFRAPELSDVLRSALERNRTIAAARATLAAARETVAAARGGFFPQVDISADADRSKASGGTETSNLYSLGATVSYAPDVFGRIRRQVEQRQALAEFQGYELAAAYLTLTGNVVTQAITIASLRSQIQATEDVIAEDEQNLFLVRRKFEAGKAARTDVLTAETQLATDRTLLPSLRQQLSTARHALSIIAGRLPAQWSPPDFDLKDFVLPGDLPLTLPSELVHRRPDILAAEAQLHADSAAIGIAAAQLYPNITLSGSLGQQASAVDTLFDQVNRFWDLTAGITGPIFHGGTLKAQERAAIDTYRASLATYEQTVLQSFQQVADSLQALTHDAELIAAAHQLFDTASTALTLQRLSYTAGKSDILQLIVAERAYQQARLGYTKAEAQRFLDTAQIFVALGGGWWRTNLQNATK